MKRKVKQYIFNMRWKELANGIKRQEGREREILDSAVIQALSTWGYERLFLGF